MKIGILYVCTGNYTIFWKDFYLTCEQFFIPGAEKHYFVFTDAPSVDFEQENPRIKRLFQENLGWPDNTLKRFHMFKKAEEQIAKMDYVFFLNANMLLIDKIDESILCEKEGLLGVKHPGYYNKDRDAFPYENNPLSTAYISPKEGESYYMGGFNGGKGSEFTKLINSLISNVDNDLAKGIIARYHDESQINRYFLDHSVKTIGAEYGWPEGKPTDLPVKIIIRDKTKWGGHAKLRGDRFQFQYSYLAKLIAKSKGIYKKHVVKRFKHN
ncbi:MAG: family 6 glucosyltransferase [Bacteroidota bacterium]|nr:family 6 glucosyltransferase [Bacteroidota bacterium]